MDNVTDLFGSRNDERQPAEPNFNYTLTVVNGEGVETIEQTGYLVMNALFVAICEGEGIIKFAVPFEDFKRIVNHGPAKATSTNLN